MRKYLAIDGGTTNTRLHYAIDGEVKETVKLKIGIRNSIDRPMILKRQLTDTIKILFQKYGKSDCIIASGMITSEMGLYFLHHLPIPAGIDTLHKGMQRVMLPAISDVPFYFIPGLKQASDDFRQCDIMRGEECEIMGLIQDQDGDCIYVLPGSHSKIITVENGVITAFTTMLTGEMVSALSDGTILKSSIDLNQPLDEEFLYKGYRFADEQGINAALFKVRILDIIYQSKPSEIYGFFLGAVISQEINQLINAKANRIIFAGQKRLAEAAALILNRFSGKEVMLVDDTLTSLANANGMIKIYEYK